MNKVCKKCNVNKSLGEFYIHPEMADGYLNICKDCTVKRVSLYGKSERGREVDKKRNKKESRKIWLKNFLKKLRKKHKLQYHARNTAWRALKDGKIVKTPCEICGEIKVQMHHNDYTKPLEVKWFCFPHHREYDIKVAKTRKY